VTVVFDYPHFPKAEKTRQDIKWQIMRLIFSKICLRTRTDTNVEVLTSGKYDVLLPFDTGIVWYCKVYYILNNFLDTTTTISTATITTDAVATHLRFSDYLNTLHMTFQCLARTPVSKKMWKSLLRLFNVTMVQRLLKESCSLMGLNE
jgi:hypothetical protein